MVVATIAEVRLAGIKAQLQQEIDAGAVICLQEVSQNWAAQLHTFLSQQGYYMITAHYGGKFNGYMGTALCFPTHAYSLVRSDINRAADALEWAPLAEDSASSVAAQTMQNIGTVERKHNVQLSVHLKHTQHAAGDEFCVSTYHMPCAFRFPHVMTCHTALAVHTAAVFARQVGTDVPFVLAGDFNFDPKSECYDLVTSGESAAVPISCGRVHDVCV